MIDGKYDLKSMMGIGGSSRVYSCVNMYGKSQFSLQILIRRF